MELRGKMCFVYKMILIFIVQFVSVECRSKQELEVSSNEGTFQPTKTFCWPDKLSFCKTFKSYNQDILLNSE